MDTPELLTHFNRLADAPGAIPRLRRLVLDLAVRGKLVAQDPGDEPARLLLERIAAEKRTSAGSLRLALSNLQEEKSSLLTLPDHWQALCIANVLVELQTGPFGSSLHQSDYVAGGIPVINPASIQDGKIVAIESMAIGQSTFDRLSGFSLREGDIVMARRGEMGRCALVTKEEAGWLCGTGCLILRPSKLIYAPFLSMFVGSPFARNFLGGAAVGTTMQNLNQSILLSMPFGLPPFSEQHRIVAKVDELMGLLDQIEARQTAREATRRQLTAASLARLSTSDTSPDDFRDHARFLLDHLPAHTTRRDQIKQLRQTILNLAVRGRLGTENGEKTAATVLSDHPDLPQTWRFVPLGEILAEDTRNGYSRRPDEAADGIPILRISAGTIRQDGIVAEEEHKLIGSIDTATRLQYGLRKGDLLACRFNGNKFFVGRLTIFDDYLKINPIYPDKLIRVRLNARIALPEFVRLAGDSDIVRTSIEKSCATTVGNWGISASNLKEIRFPLPPLAEQHRIVAKVNELMTLCDHLDAALDRAETSRTRLLDAELHTALDDREPSELAA
jgi:type I restriction enzyme S subunit